MSHESTDIYVVEDFEEAEQFRYEHNDQPVEVGTAVAYDRPFLGMPGDKPPAGGWRRRQPEDMSVVQMVCFDDIYFRGDGHE